MTQESLSLALRRCKLQHEFEIEYYESSQCFLVVLHEPVLMNWSIAGIMLLGGFLSMAAGSDKNIHLIFNALMPL